MEAKDVMLGKRNQITLPRGFIPLNVKYFHCEKQEDGSLLLIPHTAIPTRQTYFWSRRWQEGERKASGDIRSRKTRRHGSAEDLIRHLDKKRKK